MDLPRFNAAVALWHNSGSKIIPAQFPPGFPWNEEVPGEEHLCWDNCMRRCKKQIEDNCYKTSAVDPSGEFSVPLCTEERRTECFFKCCRPVPLM